MRERKGEKGRGRVGGESGKKGSGWGGKLLEFVSPKGEEEAENVEERDG